MSMIYLDLFWKDTWFKQSWSLDVALGCHYRTLRKTPLRCTRARKILPHGKPQHPVAGDWAPKKKVKVNRAASQRFGWTIWESSSIQAVALFNQYSNINTINRLISIERGWNHQSGGWLRSLRPIPASTSIPPSSKPGRKTMEKPWNTYWFPCLLKLVATD